MSHVKMTTNICLLSIISEVIVLKYSGVESIGKSNLMSGLITCITGISCTCCGANRDT